MLTHNLGYPRIGAKRELKKACEKYWAGKSTETELIEAGRMERHKNWQIQQEAGMDIVPCNDFSFYDHVQDLTFMLGAIPERYEPLKEKISDTDLYFAMCRGYQKEGFDIIAMEMTKWFDTNYHYIVPEFVKDQHFQLHSHKVIDEFKEAKAAGIEEPKPVIIGPVSYLLLGKEKEGGFNRLDLIDKLLPVYLELLKVLEQEGCKYVQLDEPFLVTDLDDETRSLYNDVYREIKRAGLSLKVVLATYFDDLGDNLDLAMNLPVDTLHIDLVRGKDQLEGVIEKLPADRNLSLGIVDGRNIWKNDFEETLKVIDTSTMAIGNDRMWLAPSCSMLHTPYDLDLETNEEALPADIKKWMAFAKQKLYELNTLKTVKTNPGGTWGKASRDIIDNATSLMKRKSSELVNNYGVQNKVAALQSQNIKRSSPFNERIKKQNEKFQLPLFPTTTIGSFPQTADVRKKRRDFKKGVIDAKEYKEFIADITKETIQKQDEIGLDVLVHGEFERNDMVEYFGELLDGIAFTENGWVQSYGSRGVKPPVIYGDVSRKEPMTLKWAEYAQSLTGKKVKGMLTGPVTILQWSFVRDDQPRYLTAYQIGLAICDEVLDLEKAGIDMIQIDEAALREGLPLKKKNWKAYLDSAVKAFRLCSWGVKDETQIHTHMCYSEFNDIIESIAAMDADVISIETSRSQMELLEAFSDFQYPNQVGPGVYDIHSPRIPTVEEMEKLLEKACQYIPPENIWVNPDCGLKTRNWEEVKPALENMVQAATALRHKMQVEA